MQEEDKRQQRRQIACDRLPSFSRRHPGTRRDPATSSFPRKSDSSVRWNDEPRARKPPRPGATISGRRRPSAAVDILQAHDVVFAEIVAALYLDQMNIGIRRFLKTVQ